MNLPKFEPIEWSPAEHIEPRQQQPQAMANGAKIAPPIQAEPIRQQPTLFMPPPSPPDLRRDYIGTDGLLHIYYPGFDELN